MPVKIEANEENVIAWLSGEIDHFVSAGLRDEIDNYILTHRQRRLILDFGAIEFMDSSGIGLVMGRYKKLKELGGEVIVQNPSASVKKVMRMAGLDKLVKFSETIVGE